MSSLFLLPVYGNNNKKYWVNRYFVKQESSVTKSNILNYLKVSRPLLYIFQLFFRKIRNLYNHNFLSFLPTPDREQEREILKKIVLLCLKKKIFNRFSFDCFTENLIN